MSEINDIRERVTGHAPGPWEFDPTEMGPANWRAYYGIVIPEFVSYAIRVGVYAEDYRGFPHREEMCVANAELVASAPDLLRIATEQAERINELESKLEFCEAAREVLKGKLAKQRSEV